MKFSSKSANNCNSTVSKNKKKTKNETFHIILLII